MTPMQKKYYKWILTKNFKDLNKGLKGQGIYIYIFLR